MAIKLIKACKDLNIGMSLAIEFAGANGFHIAKDPNVRISDDLYMLLAKEFTKEDATLKVEKDFMQQKTSNDTAQTDNYSLVNDTIQSGEIVDGIVTSISKHDVFVNVGYKQDGMVLRSEFHYNQGLKVGDQVEVYIESINDKDGVLILSHDKARKIHGWNQIIEAYENNKTLSGYVKYPVKGGLRAEVYGIEVFLPHSHIALTAGHKLEKFIGETLDFKVIQIDSELKQAIVSRKVILENELIKRHNPKYNIKLKDAKTYPYIKINHSVKYPFTITLMYSLWNP